MHRRLVKANQPQRVSTSTVDRERVRLECLSTVSVHSSLSYLSLLSMTGRPLMLFCRMEVWCTTLEDCWIFHGKTVAASGLCCNHSPQRSLGSVNGIRLGDLTPPSTETYEMEGDHEVPTTGLQLPSEENGDPDQSAA